MAFQTTFPLDWGEKEQDEFSVSIQKSSHYSRGCLQNHWHDCFEIIYITQGSRSFVAGTQSFLLAAGDILVIPPHLSHSSDGGVYDSIVLGYAESVIHTPFNSYNGIQYLLPFRNASALYIRSNDPVIGQIQELTKRTAELFASTSPTRPLEVHACILQLHAALWQCKLKNRHTSEKSYNYLTQIQSYINDNLTNDLSPYEIAEALHISHSHLCRIVKTAYRITPATLINQLRLSRAEHLLMYFPELTIADIALRIGFSDDSYFIRLFKKENGITPGQFRTNYAKLETNATTSGSPMDASFSE